MDATADDWLTILKRFAQTKSNDLITFPSSGRFLQKSGKDKPGIMLRYLNCLDDDRLVNFPPWMLRGLCGSESKHEAYEMVARWVRENILLPEIVWYLRIAEDLDADLLEKAVNAALKIGDEAALMNALAVAVGRHEDCLIDTVFMPAFDHFASKRDTR
jgi:hypothetical protein